MLPLLSWRGRGGRCPLHGSQGCSPHSQRTGMTRPSTCHHRVGWVLCRLAFTAQRPKSISEIWDLHTCTNLHVVSRTNFEVGKKVAWVLASKAVCVQEQQVMCCVGAVGPEDLQGQASSLRRGPASPSSPCQLSPHISTSPLLPSPSTVSVTPHLLLCSCVPSSAFGFPSFFTPFPLSPQHDLSEAHSRHRAPLRLTARCPHSLVRAASSCIQLHPAPLCPSPSRITVASRCLHTLLGSCKTELLCTLFPMSGGPSPPFSTQPIPLLFSSTQEASSPPEALPGGSSCSYDVPAHVGHHIFHIILNVSSRRVCLPPGRGADPSLHHGT